MNFSQNKILPDHEQVLKDMVDSGEIDYGVITDGLCATPESQDEFDREQKNKPPLTEGTDKDENFRSLIYDIIQHYPEAEWLERCRYALPGVDDASILITIEFLCGGDVIEVSGDESPDLNG